MSGDAKRGGVVPVIAGIRFAQMMQRKMERILGEGGVLEREKDTYPTLKFPSAIVKISGSSVPKYRKMLMEAIRMAGTSKLPMAIAKADKEVGEPVVVMRLSDLDRMVQMIFSSADIE